MTDKKSAPVAGGQSALPGAGNQGEVPTEECPAVMCEASGDTTLEWAKKYIERGWKIFPCHTIVDGRCSCPKSNCPDAGKHPKTRQGVKDASDDLAKILEWFGPDAQPSNIGLATGVVSGVTIIDIDTGSGKPGADSWLKLNAGFVEPQALSATTGSGGTHLVFQYASSLKNTSNTYGKDEFPAIDVRNDSGYAIVAPSVHKSGNRYAWDDWDEHPKLTPVPEHLAVPRKGRAGRPKKDNPFRRKYPISEVAEMLERIPSDDRDEWRNFGLILARYFDWSDEAWTLYNTWADKWEGTKGRNHDEIMRQAFYETSKEPAKFKELSIGTIIRRAIDCGWVPKGGQVPKENFVYLAPATKFVYLPTGQLWAPESVNAGVTPVNEDGKLIQATDWIKRHFFATSQTRDPKMEGTFIRGWDCREGILQEVDGAAVLNEYRPSTTPSGDASQAGPFLRHTRRVFPRPGDADQVLDYLAHRVQKPWEKPRFALLFAGPQGVGKDTVIAMAEPAIGPWNVANIDPDALDTDFNEHAARVLVRISETSNSVDLNRWAFNEKTKVLIAGNPDHITINPKYGAKWSVRMHCGVIVTTNTLIGGVFIPADDRRYDVIASATKAEMHLSAQGRVEWYFGALWNWFNNKGGDQHVAAFLRERNISRFSAANGQRKTAAHREVVAHGMMGDEWVMDALDSLGKSDTNNPDNVEWPDLVRSDAILGYAVKAGHQDPEKARQRLAPTITRLGYVQFENPTMKGGRWRLDGKLKTVYRRTTANLDLSQGRKLVEKLPGAGF